jgi:Na+(H+)/acetate symporter ActP
VPLWIDDYLQRLTALDAVAGCIRFLKRPPIQFIHMCVAFPMSGMVGVPHLSCRFGSIPSEKQAKNDEHGSGALAKGEEPAAH